MTAEEVAKKYLVEDYLLREPEHMDLLDWLEDHPGLWSGQSIFVHDAVVDLLDTLAQRLADDD